LFLASTLLVKFSGKGLAPGEFIHSVPYITAVATGASLTVFLATYFGFPISTTHGLFGALTGSTLVATHEVNVVALGQGFLLPLMLSPIVSLLVAMALYALLEYLKQTKQIGAMLCVCVEPKVLNQQNTVMNQTVALANGERMYNPLMLDNMKECRQSYADVIFGLEVQRIIDGMHFVSAGAVCFARGLNDTPKIAALLLLIPALSLQCNISLIAFMMAVGGPLNAKRVAETMSHKITKISHGQGLSANITTTFLVIVASKMGMPVSTTHVSVGALFGIGLTNQSANYPMIKSILLSWLLTLPCAAILAALSYKLMTFI
jgi:PiT family inorganic phosphate transporter